MKQRTNISCTDGPCGRSSAHLNRYRGSGFTVKSLADGHKVRPYIRRQLV